MTAHNKIIHLLLGVTGGVAAYKAAEFARLALKAGLQVRVVMTVAATRFIGPETFQALTGEPVYTDAWDERIPNRMPHIALTRWADVMLVAPATADFMARAAAGMADDLLATCAVSRTCPLLIAPAMNVEMWMHPATQRNARTLEADGVRFLGPAAGDQACGETGFGRLLEPEALLAAVLELAAAHSVNAASRSNAASTASTASSASAASVAGVASSRNTAKGASARPAVDDQASGAVLTAALGAAARAAGSAFTRTHVGTERPGVGDLAGRRVLITAGPTFEPIDPVRGITNGSSGKMGFAIAAACRAAGARVTLVAGPVALATPEGCDRIAVLTAAEMHAAVMAQAQHADLFFAVAAVADYTPLQMAERKIKKTGEDLTIQLKPTRDILADVAALPKPPFCIGFAAETHDLERYAREKRARKRIPVIAANLAQAAIGADDNTLWVADDSGSLTLGPAPKIELARQLVQHVVELYQTSTPASP